MSRTYETVKVEQENGIAWVILNRPDKRNAMSPQLHYDMCDVLDELEYDPQAKVLILTGAGDAWCAGQDLKLFFRDLDNKPVERTRAAAASHYWRWQKLFTYAKPTIAMVNGFCFGGGFTQLIACDFAIAAEDAQFGLSEVNWGILPGGFVSKALVEALGMRDAVWFAVTGETFDGRVAERARLVNRAVPREQLRAETVSLAERLMKINPEAIRATKQAVKNVRNMSDDAALDYLAAKSLELRFLDREKGREKGMAARSSAMIALRVMARAALMQGLIDAAFAIVIERRRPTERRWDDWVSRQHRAIARTLEMVAPVDDRFDLGDIALACALAYLDFRLPEIAWRCAHRTLAACRPFASPPMARISLP